MGVVLFSGRVHSLGIPPYTDPTMHFLAENQPWGSQTVLPVGRDTPLTWGGGAVHPSHRGHTHPVHQGGREGHTPRSVAAAKNSQHCKECDNYLL